MRDVWARIERRLAKAAPHLLADLRPPVTEADLRSLREHTSADLPTEAADSYRVHDGQGGPDTPLLGSYQLFPLAHAARVLQVLLARAETSGENGKGRIVRIRSIRWSHAWIPIAGNGVGQFYCADLGPGKAGVFGQIIRVDSAGPLREWIAAGMRAWLTDFATRLEDGRLVWHPRWGLTDAGADDGRFCADWGVPE